MAKTKQQRQQRKTRRRRQVSSFLTRAPRDDVVTIRGHGLLPITVPGNTNGTGLYIKLMPVAGTSDTTFGNFMPQINSIGYLYDMWTVKDMTVTIIPTLSMTDSTLIAVGYDPFSTGENKTPDNLADLVARRHTTMSNQNSRSTFHCDPSSYHGDWSRNGPSVSHSESSTGYLQVYSPYSNISEGPRVIAYMEVSCNFIFAGMKSD